VIAKSKGTMTTETHPRGLYTLFFTEMWERFSYYGMRALLVLFMMDEVAQGGLGFTDATATAIYGLYTAAVYLACLPGGWIADRLLGARRAVWYGGVLIAVGHFVLGVPAKTTFFLGLMLVVLGTGLLKPNISAMVGQLYPEGGARRDAGFSIFYMGINVGALLGPLVCSTLGEKYNWHWGFAAAGVGMVLGLVQFHFTRKHLAGAGQLTLADGESRSRDWGLLAAGLLVLSAIVGPLLLGWLPLDPVWLASRTTWLIVAVALAYFAWALLLAGLTAVERNRMLVIAVLFVASAMFWAGFEQAGSSLNLFAAQNTLRDLPIASFTVPAGWFQSLNAIFVIGLAPVAASLWLWLGRRQANPPLVAKMALGLILLAVSFGVAALAARQAVAAGKVWPTWLITIYLLNTLGELCLSPVGLSAVTKLAPPRLVGQMMGVWFLAASLGNLIAGLLAANVSGENLAAMPGRFMQIVLTAGITGAVLLILSRPIQRLAGGIE
jgi:POT family proton-dependent oligopeptide transporter